MLAGLYVTGVTEMYRESFCVVEHLRRGLMPPLCDCDAKAGQVLPLHKETHGVPHLEAGLPPDMLAKIDQMTRVDKLAHELAGSLLVSKVRDIEHVTGRRERVICVLRRTLKKGPPRRGLPLLLSHTLFVRQKNSCSSLSRTLPLGRQPWVGNAIECGVENIYSVGIVAELWPDGAPKVIGL